MDEDGEPKTWVRDAYMVSTDRALLDVNAINNAFGSGLMFWTKQLTMRQMQKMVDNSLCLGLYQLPQANPAAEEPILPGKET